MNAPCSLRDRKEGRFWMLGPSPEEHETMMFGLGVELQFDLNDQVRTLLPGEKCYFFEFPDQRNDASDDEESLQLSFLGGYHNDRDGDVVRNRNQPYSDSSVFNRLPRSNRIPVSSGAKIVAPPDYPEDATTAYKILMSGSLMVTVTEKPNMYVLEAIAASQDGHGIGDERFRGTIVQFAVRGEQVQFEGDQDNAVFWDVLNEPQREAIMHRILHRLLRSRGVFLPGQCVMGTAKFLTQSYIHCRKYQEALDVAVIRADIALSYGAEMYSQHVCQVVEVLEACSQFNDAATMYLEVAEVFDESIHRIAAYSNAGLAFKRDSDYTRAEECYVTALFHGRHEHAATAGKWDNLLSLYFLKSRLEATGDLCLKAEQCLVGLLHIVGYPFPNHALLAPCAREFSKYLDRRFRTPNRANSALVDATSSDSVHIFRSKLSSCWDSTVTRAIVVSVPYWDGSRKGVRRSAREFVAGPKGQNRVRQCFSPGCTVSEGLERCPCDTVFYCSKSCQRLHWHQSHKWNCPKKLGQRKVPEE